MTTGERGADGLRAEELRRGRAAWWDEAFTRAVLSTLPPGAQRVVEIGCGVGQLPAELARLAPHLDYLGVDLDPARVREAAGPVGQGRFLVARGEALPLAAGSADAVITVMTLMHVAEPLAVLREAARVAGPGGTVISVEPDNLGQRYYFDGFLPEVTRSLEALFAEGHRLRRPADLSIGPRVAALMEEAGLCGVTTRVHAICTVDHAPAGEMADRWRDLARLIAAGSGIDGAAPSVRACEAALSAWLDRVGPGPGHAVTTVPIFLSTGQAPDPG